MKDHDLRTKHCRATASVAKVAGGAPALQFLIALVCLTSAFAQQRTPTPSPTPVAITPEMLRTVPSIDLPKLKKEQFSYLGKVVNVRFNYRADDLRQRDDAYHGRLRYLDPQASRITRTLTVTEMEMVLPNEGLQWFQRVSADFNQPHPDHVFALVEASRNGGVYLRLVGRQIKRDMSGNGSVSW